MIEANLRPTDSLFQKPPLLKAQTIYLLESPLQAVLRRARERFRQEIPNPLPSRGNHPGGGFGNGPCQH